MVQTLPLPSKMQTLAEPWLHRARGVVLREVCRSAQASCWGSWAAQGVLTQSPDKVQMQTSIPNANQTMPMLQIRKSRSSEKVTLKDESRKGGQAWVCVVK